MSDKKDFSQFLGYFSEPHPEPRLRGRNDPEWPADSKEAAAVLAQGLGSGLSSSEDAADYIEVYGQTTPEGIVAGQTTMAPGIPVEGTAALPGSKVTMPNQSDYPLYASYQNALARAEFAKDHEKALHHNLMQQQYEEWLASKLQEGVDPDQLTHMVWEESAKLMAEQVDLVAAADRVKSKAYPRWCKDNPQLCRQLQPIKNQLQRVRDRTSQQDELLRRINENPDSLYDWRRNYDFDLGRLIANLAGEGVHDEAYDKHNPIHRKLGYAPSLTPRPTKAKPDSDESQLRRHQADNMLQTIMDWVGAQGIADLDKEIAEELLYKVVEVLPTGQALKWALAKRIPNWVDNTYDASNIEMEPGSGGIQKIFKDPDYNPAAKDSHDWMSRKHEYGIGIPYSYQRKKYDRGVLATFTPEELEYMKWPHGPGVTSPYTGAEGTTEYAIDPATGESVKPQHMTFDPNLPQWHKPIDPAVPTADDPNLPHIPPPMPMQENYDHFLTEDDDNVVSLDQWSAEKSDKDISQSFDSTDDMLAGVANAVSNVIDAIERSGKYEAYADKGSDPMTEVPRRGRLEGLKLVLDMITDWSFGAYPQSPEAIERKKNCMRDESLIPETVMEQLDITIEEPIVIADIGLLMEFQQYGDDEVAAAASELDPATAEDAYNFFINAAARIRRGDFSDEERGLITGMNNAFFDVADSTSDVLSKNPINKYLMLTMGELSKFINTPPEPNA